MIGQKTINSFFSPVSKKRTSENNEQDTNGETKDNASSIKKLKPTSDKLPTVTSLSPEQLNTIEKNKRAALEKLAAHNAPDGFGESWRKALKAEFGKPYFTRLMAFVSDERKKHTIYPPTPQVFTWTQMCSIRDVKVVILGQDPYHGPNQAHGLCFSVQKPVPPPPSLVNMYKELATDIEGFQHPGHGDLTGWAEQGVLLLNAVLTVRAHQANSHKDKGWEAFTDAVVHWLNGNLNAVVFMLWGSYAQKKGIAIDRVHTEHWNNNKPLSNGACPSVLFHSPALSPQVSSAYDYSSTTYLFRLTAVLVHHGDMHSGHFVTYRRSPPLPRGPSPFSAQWLWVSDDSVRRASLQEALSSNAYLLFYERVRRPGFRPEE